MNCLLFLQYGPHGIFGRDSSIRILVDSLASKIHENLDLKSLISLATGLSILAFIACLAVFQICLAFLMVALSSLSSGSMK